MPIPFLILAGAAAAGALGVGKGIKAAVDNSEAKDVNARANGVIDSAKEHLEQCRNKSGKALEALGRKKLYVCDKSIQRFVHNFEKLQNVDLQESIGLNELTKFRLDKQSFEDLKKMGDYASSILGGAAGGAVGGALAAFGAYSGAMAFGAASTGTAIATLGGAAATNATLAFLGGGSLAAGGLGMAGGAAVLGGLVAGPALAIMGFVVGAKAKANLDNAHSNLAEARKIAEELNTAASLCNGIRRRSYMFERLLIRLEVLLVPLVYHMESIIVAKGVNWPSFQREERESISLAASLAVAIKKVLDTPILTTDGRLTGESEQVANEIKSTVDKQAQS
jgi:hypothetical protein